MGLGKYHVSALQLVLKLSGTKKKTPGFVSKSKVKPPSETKKIYSPNHISFISHNKRSTRFPNTQNLINSKPVTLESHHFIALFNSSLSRLLPLMRKNAMPRFLRVTQKHFSVHADYNPSTSNCELNISSALTCVIIVSWANYECTVSLRKTKQMFLCSWRDLERQNLCL